MSETPLTAEDVLAALEEVEDPEIPVSVVDLGLVYDVTVDGGHVAIEMTLTSLACPAEEMLREDVESRVASMPGVETVDVSIVWDPPWTVERMTDAGRERIREFGITI
ncbi:MAG: metal-sulfur cluster assembly factor [Salinigranum sp.]